MNILIFIENINYVIKLNKFNKNNLLYYINTFNLTVLNDDLTESLIEYCIYRTLQILLNINFNLYNYEKYYIKYNRIDKINNLRYNIFIILINNINNDLTNINNITDINDYIMITESNNNLIYLHKIKVFYKKLKKKNYINCLYNNFSNLIICKIKYTDEYMYIII